MLSIKILVYQIHTYFSKSSNSFFEFLDTISNETLLDFVRHIGVRLIHCVGVHQFSIKRIDLPEEREMASSARKERMNFRLAPEDKELAERACVASGQSMTDYLVNLIRKDAPEVLKRQATITLTNAQFDNFMAVCHDKTLVPSPRILEAARKLDQEGF